MKRNLTNQEKNFIKHMVKNKKFLPCVSQMFVEEMNDGGMKSLKFISLNKNRILGKKLAEIEFLDEDGVTVIATFNLDNYGDPYELDVWKTDFSPLRNFPTLTCP